MYTIESNKIFVTLRYNEKTIAIWQLDRGFFTANIGFNTVEKIINGLGQPYWSR